jgi:hypothetical protein
MEAQREIIAKDISFLLESFSDDSGQISMKTLKRLLSSSSNRLSKAEINNFMQSAGYFQRNLRDYDITVSPDDIVDKLSLGKCPK